MQNTPYIYLFMYSKPHGRYRHNTVMRRATPIFRTKGSGLIKNLDPASVPCYNIEKDVRSVVCVDRKI